MEIPLRDSNSLDSNPYDLLQVPRDAGEEEIEEAYNALFDRYEPAGDDGDEEAIAMLEALNEARDTLVNPRQRAALDARLPESTAGRRRRPPAETVGVGSTRTGSRAGTSIQRTGATATARPRDA